MNWLPPLLEWVAAHPLLAGLLLGTMAAAESLVVVGLVVPGAAIMFGAGALIGTGHLHFWPMFAWAVGGAIVGDAASFWLGRRYGDRLRGVWPLRRHPELMDRGIRFFDRHGGKSVLVGRFVGPVRPIIPAVAGMMGMPALQFLGINVLSALLWAPVYLVPGMVFAASLTVAAGVAGRLVALLLLAGAGLWGLWWVAVRLRRRLAAGAGRLQRRRRRHLPGPAGAALHSLRRRAGLTWWVALVITLIVAAIEPEPRGWEQTLLVLAALPRPEAVDTVLWFLTHLGGTEALVAGVAAAALVLSAGRRLDRALRLALTVGAAIACVYLLKALYAAPRPLEVAHLTVGAAFPSAHALGAAVLYFGVAVLVGTAVRSLRRTAFIAATGVTAAVAITRVAFGLHWPLDVIAGVALGGVFAGTLGMRRGAELSPWVARRLLAAVALAVTTTAGLTFIWKPVPATVPPAPEAEALSCHDRDTLPVRAGLFDEQDRFAALWRGTAADLARALEANGWRAAAPWDLRGTLNWLHPESAVEALPPLPRWHAGRLPEMVSIRVLGERERLILRAWPLPDRLWLLDVVGERLGSDGLTVISEAVPAPQRLPAAELDAAGQLCALHSSSPQRGASD